MAVDTAHYVILKARADFPFQELAVFLSGALGIPVPDAAAGLRLRRGILLKTGETGRAEDLRRRLSDAGFDSIVRKVSELAQLTPLKAVKEAGLSETGLVITEHGRGPAASANRLEIPWESFAPVLVCAGGFFEEEIPRPGKGSKNGPGLSGIMKSAAVTLATGIPAFGNLKNKKEAPEAPRQKLNYYLDIISRGSPGGFRICGGSFDYSYLGNRKDYSSLINFGKLARDVLSFLPGALKNRGAIALEGNAGAGPRYNSRQEYEAERFWLLQLL